MGDRPSLPSPETRRTDLDDTILGDADCYEVSPRPASNPPMAQLEAVLDKGCSCHATPDATADNAGPSNGADVSDSLQLRDLNVSFLPSTSITPTLCPHDIHHDFLPCSEDFPSLSSPFALASAMSFKGSPFSPAHIRFSASPAPGTAMGQTAHCAGAYTRLSRQYGQREHQFGQLAREYERLKYARGISRLM